MYNVYILYLRKVDKLYTGSTANIKRRLREHQSNHCPTTKLKDPVLVHLECYRLKSDAQRRERFLKTTEGKRLLRQQIRDTLTAIGYSRVV